MTRELRPFLVRCVVFLVLTATAAYGNVRLPAIFSDHMVIQQKQPIRVWGWAEPGEPITVSLAGQRAETTCGQDGTWKVELEGLDAHQTAGPHELVVSGHVTVTVQDVLVGEVWVCSGQSNMQWSVRQSDNPDEEIAAANYPNIRLFTVARTIAEHPRDDCHGRWSVCGPQTVEPFSAVGYYFGRYLHRQLGLPIGLVNSSWGGTVCEAWTPRGALESDQDFQPILERSKTFDPENPNQATVLFNGMIKPLVPLGIRGAIWYQGESNTGRAQQYAKLFPTMITQWRQQWDQGAFPFYYVQLAPYRYDRADPAQCAELWEAQLQTLTLPNTGMAVTVDIGNVKDIHPKNKQDVGKRLALWALAQTYGQDVVFSGPLYESMRVENGTIRVEFRYAGGGLASRDGQPLSDFTICGPDHVFVPATATIEKDAVVVQSSQVSEPVAVRFAWRDDAEPNLINKDGLPASPFRTDQFPMVTDGRR